MRTKIANARFEVLRPSTTLELLKEISVPLRHATDYLEQTHQGERATTLFQQAYSIFREYPGVWQERFGRQSALFSVVEGQLVKASKLSVGCARNIIRDAEATANFAELTEGQKSTRDGN